MSVNYIEQGDVKLVSLILKSRDGQQIVSIAQQLVQLSIYEDLTKPLIFCEVELLDASGLKQSFPIVGEELLEIQFITPSLLNPAVYNLAVVAVEDLKPDPSSFGTTYTLKCTSVEQLASASRQVQFGTSSDPYSKLINHIMVNELQSTRPCYIEPTKGNLGNVIPKLRPLAAIDYMRKMAISINSETSGFIFFETQNGFQFRTIESLIQQNRSNPRKYIYRSEVMSSVEGMANAQRNIIKFELIGSTNAVAKLQSGIMKMVSSGFDLISKDIRSTEHDLTTNIQKMVTTDVRARSTTSQQFYQDTSKQVSDSFFIPYDSSKSNIFRDVNAAIKRAYSAMLNENIVRILIHGESDLVAGDIIDIDIPGMTGDTAKKKPDAFVSGQYIIVRLRHLIVNDIAMKHMISADVIKVGLPS